MLSGGAPSPGERLDDFSFAFGDSFSSSGLPDVSSAYFRMTGCSAALSSIGGISSTNSSDRSNAVLTSSLNQADLPSSAWNVPNK